MLRLFNLTLKLSGFPIDKARAALQAILEVPEDQYAAFTEARQNELLDYHFRHNAFYRDFLGGKRPQNWEEVPVLRKIDLQRPLKERLCDTYPENKVYVNKTSGSSGDPLVFAKDKFCHALIWANITRRFGWYGLDFNHSLQARFYGMPLDFRANKLLRLKDFLSHRYRFNIFDFSDAALQHMVSKFRNTKFDYINGYTNSIVLLAKYLQKNNWYLDEICPTLKVCIVTSEMLLETDRKLLEERFRIPIVNEYGSAELDIIALQHPNGIWKVNAENLYVEILDDQDRVLPLGQQGRIVVTSLYNKAHPMIRYEVGDLGALDEKSTPKNPILKSLTGRTNDVAILPSGKKSPGMTFYSITKKLFGDEGNVKEFVITQTKIDTFEIQYTSERNLSDVEIDHIKAVFSDFLEPDLNYHFLRRETIERSKSGKLKQFRSLLPSS